MQPKQPYLMFQSRVKEILDSNKPITPITPLRSVKMVASIANSVSKSFEAPRPLSALIKEFGVQSNKKKTTFQFVREQYQQDQQFSNNRQERRAILKEYISQSFVGDESFAAQSSSRQQLSPRKIQQPIYRLTQKDINLYDNWKIKFQSRYTVIFESLYENYTNILMAAHQRQYQDFINISIDIIGEQIKFQRKEFFIKYLLFCSQFFFEIEDYNKSAFFAKQTFIVALYFQFIKYKIHSLLMLAKVSIRLKDQSIIYLLNSLEYTWYDNDLENEQKIYDIIGLCLYYKQMSLKAQFFHNRFANGVIEPQTSNLKRNTIQTLILFEKNLEDKYGKCSNINFFLLNQLQLPQHYNQRRKRRLSFMFGQVNTQEAYETETFDKIYPSIEMYLLNDLTVETIIQANFQEQVYKNPNHFIYEGNSPPSAFPKHILEIKQRHKSFQEKHNRQMPFFSSNENKLKRRLGEKYQVEKIFEQVRNRVEYNLKISKLDQVYLNHQNYKPDTNQIVLKVKQLLEELIK